MGRGGRVSLSPAADLPTWAGLSSLWDLAWGGQPKQQPPSPLETVVKQQQDRIEQLLAENAALRQSQQEAACCKQRLEAAVKQHQDEAQQLMVQNANLTQQADQLRQQAACCQKQTKTAVAAANHWQSAADELTQELQAGNQASAAAEAAETVEQLDSRSPCNKAPRPHKLAAGAALDVGGARKELPQLAGLLKGLAEEGLGMSAGSSVDGSSAIDISKPHCCHFVMGSSASAQWFWVKCEWQLPAVLSMVAGLAVRTAAAQMASYLCNTATLSEELPLSLPPPLWQLCAAYCYLNELLRYRTAQRG
eukprot:gene4705-4956_t